MGLISASVRLLTNARPFDVAIVDANGDQITAFGGGGGSNQGSNAVITSVPPLGSTQVLLAANPNRKSFIIVNDTQKTLRIAYAPTATAALYTLLIPSHSDVTLTGYTGVVSGIWDNNPNGTCTVTEIS